MTREPVTTTVSGAAGPGSIVSATSMTGAAVDARASWAFKTMVLPSSAATTVPVPARSLDRATRVSKYPFKGVVLTPLK